MTTRDDDLLNLGQLLGALRVGWLRLFVLTLVGAGVAGVLLLVLPKRWEGRASVLVSSGEEAGGSLLQKAGIPEGIAASILGRSAAGQMETELELLRSRRLIGEVADSLQLGVRLRSPGGTAASTVVASFTPVGAFRRFDLTGERSGTGWRIQGKGVDTTVSAGASLELPVGTLSLSATAPDRFSLRLLDREDATTRLQKRLSITRAGGEIAAATVRWDDSLTAAEIPNVMVARYLALRRRVDQGVNAERYAFATAQADSLERQLKRALEELKLYQQRSQSIDPEITGKVLVEASTTLHQQLSTVTLEHQALRELLTRIGTDRPRDVRQLAAFPAFLRSAGINDLLSQLIRLESERLALLETHTDRDPAVAGRTEAINNVEAQLLPLARTYADALGRNRSELRTSADSVDRLLAAMPATSARFFELTREVQRLNATALALQSQRLQLRMATITEGGNARQVDVAEPNKKAAWPSPTLFLVLGVAGGLLAGVVAALLPLVAAPQRAPEGARHSAA
jgi:uncharacterized protein involved in exopolysaccharide biosynthesis